jgi:CubicO group peptidase (beta-lactamase class C family)
MGRLGGTSAVTLVFLAFAAVAGAASVATPSPLPMTGHQLPGMGAWDAAAKQVMTRQGIPGAVLIVSYQGRVVLERGFGYADVATHQLVQPDDAFRLASVTKPQTATAIAQLIERHKLALSTRPFKTILAGLRGPHGERPVDPRIYEITIKELLEHTAGWDISKIGFDPTLDSSIVESGLGTHTAPTCQQNIEFMLGRRLNTTPGKHYAYSNLGYCVLGHIIAKVMHTSYGRAMKELVWGPLGMTHTTMSLPQLSTRLPNEVHYYGQGSTDTGPLGPYLLPLVGTFGAAGVVSTAQDLLRYVVITSAVVPGSKPWYDPNESVFVQPPYDPPGTEIQFEFDGSLPGTTTSLGMYDQVDYVFLGNSRNPQLEPDNTPFFTAAKNQTSWPRGNLFRKPIP